MVLPRGRFRIGGGLASHAGGDLFVMDVERCARWPSVSNKNDADLIQACNRSVQRRGTDASWMPAASAKRDNREHSPRKLWHY
jgi:hypothetical protein